MSISLLDLGCGPVLYAALVTVLSSEARAVRHSARLCSSASSGPPSVVVVPWTVPVLSAEVCHTVLSAEF